MLLEPARASARVVVAVRAAAAAMDRDGAALAAERRKRERRAAPHGRRRGESEGEHEQAPADQRLHRRLEKFDLALLWRGAVRVHEQIVAAVVHRLEQGAGLHVHDAAGGDLEPLRRVAEVHRQRP
jgi:hypothetical protein